MIKATLWNVLSRTKKLSSVDRRPRGLLSSYAETERATTDSASGECFRCNTQHSQFVSTNEGQFYSTTLVSFTFAARRYSILLVPEFKYFQSARCSLSCTARKCWIRVIIKINLPKSLTTYQRMNLHGASGFSPAHVPIF